MTDPKPVDDLIDKEIKRIDAMIRSGPMERIGQLPQTQHALVRPKNASSIILIKGEPGEEKIVMGKRNKVLKFMPGALVFPGGAVDRGDGRIKGFDELHPETTRKLIEQLKSKASATRVHGLGMAAVRELAEETGLLVGQPSSTSPKHKDWEMFAEQSMAPTVNSLRLIARAITPPGISRRFDTWFFAMRLSPEHHVPDEGFISSGELEDLQWIRPSDAMGHETREITRVILVELMNRLRSDPTLSPAFPAPFYQTKRGKFIRTLM